MELFHEAQKQNLSVIPPMPDEPELQPQLQVQIDAFKEIQDKIVAEKKFPGKNPCLRMVNADGEVQEEFSTQLLRAQETWDHGNQDGRHLAFSDSFKVAPRS